VTIKGLHVDKKEIKVTDEEVDKAVNELRNRHAKMVAAPADAIIEKGDFAVIDFAGTVDGEPFSGGEGKGYPLEVGSGSFIPGFEDQLIGLKKGDATDVDVTFPETYFVKELAGKEAVFKVNIQEVKHKELPELTDEYVAANSDVKTVAELKAEYRKQMEAAAAEDTKNMYEKDLVDTAVKNAKFEIPGVMIEDKISQMIEEMKLSLESRKMSLESYLQYTGMDMAKLREAQKPRAEEAVRTDLVLDAIAKKENIQVDMKDVDAEIKAIADQHGASVQDVKSIIQGNNTMGLLLANILRRKAAHVIIDSAK
jgi:trigger factor